MKRVLAWLLALFRRSRQDSVIVPPANLASSKKKSRGALKRKAFKHCVRANPDAPLMQQARDLGH